MSVRTAVTPLAIGVLAALAVAGCNSGSGPHAAAKARASAMATSSQARAAKQAAEKAAAKCQPKGVSVSAWEYQLAASHTARVRFYECEQIPPAARQAAGVCVVNAAKAAIGAQGARQARETRFITALSGCDQA